MVPRDVASVLKALRGGKAISPRADETLVTWLETILVRVELLDVHIRWLQAQGAGAPQEPELDDVTFRGVVTDGVRDLQPDLRARLLFSPTVLYGLSESIAQELTRRDEPASEVWVDVLRRLGEEYMAETGSQFPEFKPSTKPK